MQIKQTNSHYNEQNKTDTQQTTDNDKTRRFTNETLPLTLATIVAYT